MNRLTNQSISHDTTWTEDGLTFTEVIRQAYSGMVMSAGMVEGHPTDTLYIKLERDGNVDLLLLVRPDEMAALGWIATGALWSLHIED